MRSLVVDAYDSFVYVLVQYLGELGLTVEVRRNDVCDVASVADLRPDLLVLGPGPGHPADSGYVELIKNVAPTVPIFGVCLGLQAVGLAFGASIGRAKNLMHGKVSVVGNDQRGCFASQPPEFLATRYHSLVVERDSVPDDLVISAASTDDHEVMGLRHISRPIEAVQFHPESILTENGLGILKSFIDTYC